MANQLCKDVSGQFDLAIGLIAKTIPAFSHEQWTRGISHFEVPAKVAYHLIDSLDHYFREEKENERNYRFGGGWDELPDEKQPSQQQLLEYLDEMRERISNYLESITDEDLTSAYSKKRSLLGHFIYAIHHTMHHHGALTALAVYHKCDPDVWQ